MKKRKNQAGFTLIELMIVIAIVGILAAVAMPMYTDYTNKARFSGLVAMTDPYKLATALCMQTEAEADCDAGANGIPAAFANAGHADLAADITVLNGTITFQAAASAGGYTFSLNPAAANGVIQWAQEGNCAAAKAC